MNTLEVEFHNGRVYQYNLVPGYVFDELMSAESKGGCFNRLVREKYPTTEL